MTTQVISIDMFISSMQNINFSKPTILCNIMGKNKSHKGNSDIKKSWHNYTPLYHYLFKNFRESSLRIFELGLTNDLKLADDEKIGGSLYGWREYFPNSTIFGADGNRNNLFRDTRISTYHCNHTDTESIANLWRNNELKENLDVIIENGYQDFHSNVCFFEHSIHKLAIGGLYVIENIETKNAKVFDDKIEEWKIEYPHLKFLLVFIGSDVNNRNNNVMLIYRIY